MSLFRVHSLSAPASVAELGGVRPQHIHAEQISIPCLLHLILRGVAGVDSAILVACLRRWSGGELLLAGLLLLVVASALLSLVLGVVLLFGSVISQPPGTKSPALFYGGFLLLPSLFLAMRFAQTFHR